MSGESSKRSSLVDVTFQQLHSILSNPVECSYDQVKDYLKSRKGYYADLKHPFGTPNNASKTKVESGSVTLADGVTLQTDVTDKEYIFAISKKLQIDEIQALILLRSFFCNEGIPSITSDTSIVEELVEAITPFYLLERLSVLRVLIPLFRAKEDPDDPLYDVTSTSLPEIIPEKEVFVQTVIDEYLRRSKERLPEDLRTDPKSATVWAKQDLKEQLVLLEVLFWMMWGSVPCGVGLVVKIFEAAYSSSLGSVQANNTLLLDEESTQLQQDIIALWILITIEVLELENVGEPEFIRSHSQNTYIASTESLKRLHELIISHGDSQYVCTYLSWAFVLSRLALSPSHKSFVESLSPSNNRGYQKSQEPIFNQMLKACLDPDAGLFRLIYSLLTQSPLFVTSVAWKTGSWVTDPNHVAYRSLLKGLIMSLVELIPVEHIPEFDLFVEVWVTLFGRSEGQSVTAICAQFWQSDWKHGLTRRAIFDVARSRFPIQTRPLLRLLRAMTGIGFLDTDTLSTADHVTEVAADLKQQRDLCARHVFYYFDQLSSYSQVVPLSACSGAHALYERQQERYGMSSPQGLTYVNLRPIKLPGGSVLPARSVGRVISGDNSENLVICWHHQHSGWKLILELLTDYVNRKRLQNSGPYQDISFAPRSNVQSLSLTLQDIGVETEDDGDSIVTEALDLVRSLIYDNAAQAEQLMKALEAGDSVVSHKMTETQAPDLVQLTTMILEEALSRSNRRSHVSHLPLITSAMNVLAAILSLPSYANRVWLYIRSTTALFGADKTAGFAAMALAGERTIGHYTMTLAILHLVQQLFREASVTILPDNGRVQQLKEEVLLRTVRFVHTEIWVEHLNWKYVQLGDRFEIGRRISALYADILEHAPPTLSDGPFAVLSQTIGDALLFRANTSSVNPLISPITSGRHMLRILHTSRRLSDARRLVLQLESHLHLSRLLLEYKQQSQSASTLCLLEQTLCSRVAGGAASFDSIRTKSDPIDTIAHYVQERYLGVTVPLEAIRLLYALCSSLSLSPTSSPTIIGHLNDPEATVTSFVKIVRHPYDDLQLRNAIWQFIALVVDKEPALANLFVAGRFRANPLSDMAREDAVKDEGQSKGKQKETQEEQQEKGDRIFRKEANDGDKKDHPINATETAREMLENWRNIWETNPQLLVSILQFLSVVWEHGLEHRSILAGLRQDTDLWNYLVELVKEDFGPVPPHETEFYELSGNILHADVHEAVSTYAYRVAAKSYAVRIFGLDIDMEAQSRPEDPTSNGPKSFAAIEPSIKDKDQLSDLLSDAIANTYSPRLYDQLVDLFKSHFPGLVIEHLLVQKPKEIREYGDGYSFDTRLIRTRLSAYSQMAEVSEDVTAAAERQFLSINMNLSLSDSQKSLAESWGFLLRKLSPLFRSDATTRTTFLTIASTLSTVIAEEERPGEVMAYIHESRLALLLSLLELAWFSLKDRFDEVKTFAELVRNARGMILNEAQSPINSIIRKSTAPFHRYLLQILYYCAKQGRPWMRQQKTLNAEQRLLLANFVEASLAFTIEALRIIFMNARAERDVDLDRDMELLVAVFEQCSRSDINPSPIFWLVRCQETDVIRISLELYAHTDLVGLSELPLLHSRKQPLYGPHVLRFHMALASNSTAAERLASEGILSAYSNNFISSAISLGQISVVLAELPGERNPAHAAYCSMLSIITTIITALGRHNHYFDAEVCGFVQLYGEQFTRALSWTIGDPITFPLLEEAEQVVNLFYAIAANSPSTAQSNPAIEKVLAFFTVHALNLLQQLNYAITHPNHLASLLEPVTNDERSQLDKEKQITETLQRPLVMRLLYLLFRLSSNVISTLLVISKADSVLLTPEDDWPLHEALVVPHSKVVLGEPASLGTLLELGNGTLDILRDLANRPTSQSIISAPVVATSVAEALDVRQSVITTRRNLETVLTYASTQLVMWLAKPEFDASSPDMDTEDSHTMDVRPDVSLRERRAQGSSLVMAERLRRGMTSEMASDLKSLLSRSKPIVAKTASMIGSDSIDIIQILINFLQEHISSHS